MRTIRPGHGLHLRFLRQSAFFLISQRHELGEQQDLTTCPHATSCWHLNQEAMDQWLIFDEAESCMCAKSLQLCQIMCDPLDCSPPGSSVYGISRQEHWSGLPCHPPGDCPSPGIEPASLMSRALTGRFLTPSSTWSWIQSIQFSRSVVSDSLRCHELQHSRPPCPSPTPEVYSNSCPLSRWCHPTISSSVVPFSSHLQSFLASGSFQKSQFFISGGQILEFQL